MRMNLWKKGSKLVLATLVASAVVVCSSTMAYACIPGSSSSTPSYKKECSKTQTTNKDCSKTQCTPKKECSKTQGSTKKDCSQQQSTPKKDCSKTQCTIKKECSKTQDGTNKDCSQQQCNKSTNGCNITTQESQPKDQSLTGAATEETTDETTDDSPKTSDETNIIALFALMAISGAVVVVMVIRKKRNA